MRRLQDARGAVLVPPGAACARAGLESAWSGSGHWASCRELMWLGPGWWVACRLLQFCMACGMACGHECCRACRLQCNVGAGVLHVQGARGAVPVPLASACAAAAEGLGMCARDLMVSGSQEPRTSGPQERALRGRHPRPHPQQLPSRRCRSCYALPVSPGAAHARAADGVRGAQVTCRVRMCVRGQRSWKGAWLCAVTSTQAAPNRTQQAAVQPVQQGAADAWPGLLGCRVQGFMFILNSTIKMCGQAGRVPPTRQASAQLRSACRCCLLGLNPTPQSPSRAICSTPGSGRADLPALSPAADTLLCGVRRCGTCA